MTSRIPFLPILILVASPAFGQTPRFAELRRMLPVESEATSTVVVGDLDGDGDTDAVIGHGDRWDRSRGVNLVYRNDGTGVFAVGPADLPEDAANTQALVLGDVDGDGDLDLVEGRGPYGPPGQLLRKKTRNRLYRNDGTGTFIDVSALQLPPDVDSTTALAFGDLDGDGDLDLLVGNGDLWPFNRTPQQNRLYRNDGSGFFIDDTVLSLPAAMDLTVALALGDVDGDGDLDAVIGNEGGVLLYLNGGSGIFTDATAGRLPTVARTITSLALGDVDGDSDTDLLIGKWDQNLLLANDGTGRFTDVTTGSLPAHRESTQAIVLADADGDGDLDALIANSDLNAFPPLRNRLYLNDGTGRFTDVSATAIPDDPSLHATCLAVDDLDGDGDLDALVGSAMEDRIYLNDGAARFFDCTAGSSPRDAHLANGVALADVDGDGDLDAWIADEGFYSMTSLYLNDGTGVLADATSTNLPPLSSPAKALAIGDVDGDSDLDALIGRDGRDMIWVNDGNGVFTVTTRPFPGPNGADETRSVALGDVDGDGDLDAWIGNGHDSCGIRLFVNDGAGGFTDQSSSRLPPSSMCTWSIALGDVDGDGDLDAILGEQYGGSLRQFVNDGSGVFADLTATRMPAISISYWPDSALGDLDGDLDLDLMVAARHLHCFRNDGTGTFSDVTGSHLPASQYAYDIELGDFDEDGDLDAIGAQDGLLLNDGTGVFSVAPGSSTAVSFGATGDVDGDEDLDGFSAGRYQSRLYANLLRQLAWHGVPRIGKPLVMDLHGPSGGAWILASSPRTGAIAHPPFGTLRLDPTSTFTMAAGLLDARGDATAGFSVPANPALIGWPLYWQALTAPPPRLGNLECTSFTQL